MRRTGALALALVLAFSACRAERSLEETAGEGVATDPEPAVDDRVDDPLLVELRRVETVFVRRGDRVLDTGTLSTPDNGRVDRIVELDEQRCYTFVAVSLPDTLDLDLQLRSPNGQLVAQDAAPDHFPVIQNYCAETSGSFALRARFTGGSGRVALSGFRLSAEDAEWGHRLEELRDQFAAQSEPLGPVEREYLGENEVQVIPLALLESRCYAVVASGDAAVHDLDARLIDRDGRTLSQDVAVDNYPVIERVCPDESGAYDLRFRMHSGEGMFAWQLLQYR